MKYIMNLELKYTDTGIIFINLSSKKNLAKQMENSFLVSKIKTIIDMYVSFHNGFVCLKLAYMHLFMRLTGNYILNSKNDKVLTSDKISISLLSKEPTKVYSTREQIVQEWHQWHTPQKKETTTSPSSLCPVERYRSCSDNHMSIHLFILVYTT